MVTLAASQQAKNPRLHARIEEDRKASEALLCQFIRVADVCLEQGGNASFEWPRYCTGWSLGPLLNWIASSIPFWLDGKRPQLLPSVLCGFLVNQHVNWLSAVSVSLIVAIVAVVVGSFYPIKYFCGWEAP